MDLDELKTRIFVRRIQERLKERSWTQSEVANRTGVTQSTVSRLLSGDTKKVSKETAEKIASAFEEPLDALLASGVTVRKPRWHRELLKNSGHLFWSIFKAVRDMATLDPEEAWEEISENWKHLESPERGWVLLSRSMAGAIADLAREAKSSSSHPLKIGDEWVSRTIEAIDVELEKAGVILDNQFFDHPAPSFVAAMNSVMAEQLHTAGMLESEAKSVTHRLPTYFLYALRREEAGGRERYAKLFEEFDSPFDGALENERRWVTYRAWLQRRVEEPLFHETFSLKDVFVPLRCWVPVPEERKPATDRSRRDEAPRQKQYRLAMLFDELEQWLASLDANYKTQEAVRIVEGVLGYGKSSSARMFAARLAESGERRAVYVPLHRFDVEDSLGTALDRFASCHQPPIPEKLLETENHGKPWLLILDGLDELSAQGKSGAELAHSFLTKVLTWLARYGDTSKVAILSFGRPIAVSSAIANQGQEIPVLELVPFPPFEVSRNREVTDPSQLATTDQRDNWWKQYGDIKGNDYSQFLEQLKKTRKEIADLSGQPLLNYLLALWQSHGKHDLANLHSVNELYRDILHVVWERPWGEKFEGKPSLEEFENFLEEMALAAWHGAGRQATVKQIRNRLSKYQCGLLAKFTDQGVSGIVKLLLGFYCRSVGGRHDEEAFEFTHKSFGEYLTARRMVSGMIQIHTEFEADQKKPPRSRPAFDDRAALIEWVRIFGPSRLDEDLFRFIEFEFQTRDEQGQWCYQTEQLDGWRVFLAILFGNVLNEGTPMEEFFGELKTLVELNRQSLNAEEALLSLHVAVANALARRREERTTDSIPFLQAKLGGWLRRLHGHRRQFDSGQEKNLRLRLSHLNLEITDLSRADLDGANLDGANLDGANLDGANLDGTSLIGAGLIGARLDGANLDGANLDRARLEQARLVGASLDRARLEQTSLVGANLYGASLEQAILDGANLYGARLIGANLYGASLVGANLYGARLIGANLDRAILIGARLDGANLDRASLDGASLDHAFPAKICEQLKEIQSRQKREQKAQPASQTNRDDADGPEESFDQS